jgi:mercuric ion transport protein
MIQVELIYDADCPAASQARANLRAAMLRAGLAPRWVEWERSSPDAPGRVRAYGSPTILINGRDVGGSEAAGAACCRIYQPQAGQFAAVPPVELILAALREAQTRRDSAEAQNSSEKQR